MSLRANVAEERARAVVREGRGLHVVAAHIPDLEVILNRLEQRVMVVGAAVKSLRRDLVAK